jgi:GntR family transcriptional regulator
VVCTVIAVTNERKSWLLGPISPAADGTLYQQIVDRLKREVSEGRLKPGTALPSFRQLAEDLLVSVITVKRAYEELEREGIIFRRQGLGTFVAEQGRDRSREVKLTAARELLRQAFREAAEAGLRPGEILDLVREIQKETKTYEQRY